MAQANQQMQDALAQMDAVQKDREEMAAAQNGAGDGQGEQPGQQPGGGKKPGGQGQGNKGGQGQGMGGPGVGAGGSGSKAVASYTVKQEIDASQHIDSGRMIAKTFVKAPADKGESKIQFTPAADAAVKDATDDVPEASVPKDAQDVVKHYFNTIDNGQ